MIHKTLHKKTPKDLVTQNPLKTMRSVVPVPLVTGTVLLLNDTVFGVVQCFYMVLLCSVIYFVCLCVLCPQCCQCLLFVHSWPVASVCCSSIRDPLDFLWCLLDTIYTYMYLLPQSPQNFGHLILAIVNRVPKAAEHNP
jgi:hypothetical protein